MAFASGHDLAWLLPLLGLAAGAATFAGGALALRFESRLHLILGFSAGAVVGVALFDLIPEALELGAAHDARSLMAVVGLGFIAYLIVDRALLIASTDSVGHRGHLGAGSLTLHSLMDGLGIGLGFQVSPAVGVVLAVAVLAHDFSDGVNTVSLSLAGSSSPRSARLWLAANAAAPLAGIGLSRLVAVPKSDLALAIAAFGGFFLYIGASELLPASQHSHPRTWTTAATAGGFGLIWLVVRLAGG
jgi:zinc transporter ZupT